MILSTPQQIPDWLHVEGPADAMPVLLVSGLGGTAAFWEPVRARLAGRCRVACYDQPGCGARPVPAAALSIAQLAEDAAAAAQRAFGDRPITLIGHSTGGIIAQTFAAYWPGTVTKLVLSGTWLRPNTYMRELFAFRAALLRRAPELSVGCSALLANLPEGIELGSLAPQPMDETHVATALDRIEALMAFDGTALLNRIDCAALILGAEDDRVIPTDRQHDLGAALPHAALTIFSEGGHFFPRTQPKTFTHCVTSWLGLGDGRTSEV